MGVQVDALERAHCTRVFSEKISTRIKARPELEKALTLAQKTKQAAPPTNKSSSPCTR